GYIWNSLRLRGGTTTNAIISVKKNNLIKCKVSPPWLILPQQNFDKLPSCNLSKFCCGKIFICHINIRMFDLNYIINRENKIKNY
ncbi:MAG: hypothetical protein SVR08_10130, partial [Spirochaetota bacterium]|nr:hypothetical protein [Spirochaetota bacterium]